MKILQNVFLVFVLAAVFGVTTIAAATFAKTAPDLKFFAQTARKSEVDDANALLKTALELYRQKKFDEALTNCAKAAEMSPNDFRPHALAGLVYTAQWKLKSASEAFARAISLKPDNKQLYLMKADADRRCGEKEEALAACRKALEIDPSYAEAYFMIGETLGFDEKRRDEAVAAYRSALKANPRLLSAYESLGRLLAYTNDEKGAEEAFRQAMWTDQKQMAGRFALGRLLVKQGRLKEAREIWEGRTADKDLTFPNFITLLERAERLKRATDALAQKPSDPEMLMQMGLAVMEGESWSADRRQERAIVYFKKVLEIKPGFVKAQYEICKAYIQLASSYKDENKNVDEELAKLKRLDPQLGAEMEEYRKTYSGGIKGTTLNLNQ